MNLEKGTTPQLNFDELISNSGILWPSKLKLICYVCQEDFDFCDVGKVRWEIIN